MLFTGRRDGPVSEVIANFSATKLSVEGYLWDQLAKYRTDNGTHQLDALLYTTNASDSLQAEYNFGDINE